MSLYEQDGIPTRSRTKGDTSKDTFRSLMIILMYLKQDHLFNRTVQAVSVTSMQTVQLNSNNYGDCYYTYTHAVYNV